jgi:3,4-dihydroxy 2-butanone 4-phosphate synthase/GTP cyclohydrolase II
LDLGVSSIRPITNNPRKLVGLEGYGISLGERVPIISPATAENAEYLETKRTKLGHLRAI